MKFIIRDEENIRPQPLNKKRKKRSVKTLGSLEVGDRFEFVNLKGFRHLWIYSKSFTAIGYKGERKNKETKEWTPYKNFSAHSALVRLLS